MSVNNVNSIDARTAQIIKSSVFNIGLKFQNLKSIN